MVSRNALERCIQCLCLLAKDFLLAITDSRFNLERFLPNG